MTWIDILKSDRCVKPAMAHFNKQVIPLFQQYTEYRGEKEIFDYVQQRDGEFVEYFSKLQEALNQANPEPKANNYRRIYLDKLSRIINETMFIYENCSNMEDLR